MSRQSELELNEEGVDGPTVAVPEVPVRAHVSYQLLPTQADQQAASRQEW
jgi:hypothetical protein